MPKPRTAARFVLAFAATYVLLVLPWPGLGVVHAWATRIAGRLLFSCLGEGVEFEAIDARQGAERRDVRLVFHSGEIGGLRESLINSRHLIHLPSATFLALLAATPSGKRKRALLWGAAPMLLFLALRLGLVVADGLTETAPFAERHPYAKAMIWRARAVLAENPSVWFIAPVAIWALAAFDRRDWRSLMERGATAPDTSKETAMIEEPRRRWRMR